MFRIRIPRLCRAEAAYALSYFPDTPRCASTLAELLSSEHIHGDRGDNVLRSVLNRRFHQVQAIHAMFSPSNTLVVAPTVIEHPSLSLLQYLVRNMNSSVENETWLFSLLKYLMGAVVVAPDIDDPSVGKHSSLLHSMFITVISSLLSEYITRISGKEKGILQLLLIFMIFV